MTTKRFVAVADTVCHGIIVGVWADQWPVTYLSIAAARDDIGGLDDGDDLQIVPCAEYENGDLYFNGQYHTIAELRHAAGRD